MFASKTETDYPQNIAACLLKASKPPIQVKNILLGMMVLWTGFCPADTVKSGQKEGGVPPHSESEGLQTDVSRILAWVVDSGDSGGLPFIILDKKEARVHVFGADARRLGTAPALIGSAVGDHSVAGIGERKLSAILPQERTTPAGRFVASLDRNLQGREIMWVDYDSAISLHPVITSNIKERRAERLATPTPLDNRISYGCINVSAIFFKDVVHAAFAGTNGIVYVLPETRPVSAFFGPYTAGIPDR